MKRKTVRPTAGGQGSGSARAEEAVRVQRRLAEVEARQAKIEAAREKLEAERRELDAARRALARSLRKLAPGAVARRPARGSVGKAILAFLADRAEGAGAQSKEIADALHARGYSRSTVRDRLARLAHDGAVAIATAHGGSLYTVAPKAPQAAPAAAV